MICPTPHTVIPSVAEGETVASVVQVPCAYPACAAVKVPTAPATITRNHFLPLQKCLNMFFLSFESYSFIGNIRNGELGLSSNLLPFPPSQQSTPSPNALTSQRNRTYPLAPPTH